MKQIYESVFLPVVGVLSLVLVWFTFSQFIWMQYAIFGELSSVEILGLPQYTARFIFSVLLLAWFAFLIRIGINIKVLVVILVITLIGTLSALHELLRSDASLLLSAVLYQGVYALNNVFSILFLYAILTLYQDKSPGFRLTLTVALYSLPAVLSAMFNDRVYDSIEELTIALLVPWILATVALFTLLRRESDSADSGASPVSSGTMRVAILFALLMMIPLVDNGYLFSSLVDWEVRSGTNIAAIILMIAIVVFSTLIRPSLAEKNVLRLLQIALALSIGYTVYLIFGTSDYGPRYSDDSVIFIPFYGVQEILSYLIPALGFWYAYEVFSGRKSLAAMSLWGSLTYVSVATFFIVIVPILRYLDDINSDIEALVIAALIITITLLAYRQRKSIQALLSSALASVGQAQLYGYNPTPWLNYSYSNPQAQTTSAVINLFNQSTSIVSIGLRAIIAVALLYDWGIGGTLGLLLLSEECSAMLSSIYWSIAEVTMVVAVVIGLYTRIAALLLLLIEALMIYWVGAVGANLDLVLELEETHVLWLISAILVVGGGRYSFDHLLKSGNIFQPLYYPVSIVFSGLVVWISYINYSVYEAATYQEYEAFYAIHSHADDRAYQIVAGTRAHFNDLDSQVMAAYYRSGRTLQEGKASSLDFLNDFIEADYSNQDYRVSTLDFWGTPYQIKKSGTNTHEYRSAGPDQIIDTEDDIIYQCNPDCTYTYDIDGLALWSWIISTDFWHYEPYDMRSIAHYGSLGSYDVGEQLPDKTCGVTQ